MSHVTHFHIRRISTSNCSSCNCVKILQELRESAVMPNLFWAVQGWGFFLFRKVCKWCKRLTRLKIKTFFFIPVAELRINCVWESVNNDKDFFSWNLQFIQRLNLNWFIFRLMFFFWNAGCTHQHCVVVFFSKVICCQSIKLREVQRRLRVDATRLRGESENSRKNRQVAQLVIILAGQPASANGNAALERWRNGRNFHGCWERRRAGGIGVVKTSPAARDLRNTVSLDLRFLFLWPPGWGLNSPINRNELHKASRKKGENRGLNLIFLF